MTEPLTPADLDAVQAAYDAATPGDWIGDGHSIYVGHPTSEIVEYVRDPADRAFITKARVYVPALVAEVRRLLDALDRAGRREGELLDMLEAVGRKGPTPPTTGDAVYLAAARAYCLASYNYNPEVYTDPAARERHIQADTASTAGERWFRAVVDAVACTGTPHTFTAREWFFLHGRVEERQRQAEDQGIPADDPSSVYRLNLIRKLRENYIAAHVAERAGLPDRFCDRRADAGRPIAEARWRLPSPHGPRYDTEICDSCREELKDGADPNLTPVPLDAEGTEQP